MKPVNNSPHLSASSQPANIQESLESLLTELKVDILPFNLSADNQTFKFFENGIHSTKEIKIPLYSIGRYANGKIDWDNSFCAFGFNGNALHFYYTNDNVALFYQRSVKHCSNGDERADVAHSLLSEITKLEKALNEVKDELNGTKVLIVDSDVIQGMQGFKLIDSDKTDISKSLIEDDFTSIINANMLSSYLNPSFSWNV